MHEAVRRQAAFAAAQAAGADSMLVVHPPDVRYLTGFTGSSGAVALRGRRAVLFTDGRYTSQARRETESGTRDLRVVIGKGNPGVLAAAWLASAGALRCAFDANSTTVESLETMRKAVPPRQRRTFFLATSGLIAELRQIKDAGEIATMRRAAALSCRLFRDVLQHMVPGVSEVEVAAQIEFAARRAGVEGMSFETIVASGRRSSLPHGKASSAKMRRGFVTLDFGVVLDGYCSDMTRTVYLGRASHRERDVYHSVLEAQQAAVAMVAPGVRCADVDEAARSVLRKAGLQRAFSHSTGHGVGLEIHEGPRIAAKQEQMLETGMVITIEPGVYLKDQYGVRIEDMVLVTKTGAEVLTRSSPTTWVEV